MDVHVRDLRYFVAVAEELNFTRAAQRLFISQPALSKQIRLLERELRVELFTRDRRQVGLTAAGEALLAPARELIASWDTAQQVVADAAAAADAVLRIGFSTSVGRGLLSAIQERISQTRPNWRLALRQVDWDDPTGGVGDRSSDLAIIWLPVPAAEAFSSLVLAEEPRHVALPVDHPLAAGPRVEFADLLDEPFLALPEQAATARDHWLAADERGGRPLRVGGTVTNAEETFEAVLAGLGVALLSAGNAEIYRRPGITTLPVNGIGPSQLALLWRAEDHRAVVRDFIEATAHALDSVPPASSR